MAIERKGQKRIEFWVPDSVAEQFKIVCRQNGLPYSTYLESFMCAVIAKKWIRFPVLLEGQSDADIPLVAEESAQYGKKKRKSHR